MAEAAAVPVADVAAAVSLRVDRHEMCLCRCLCLCLCMSRDVYVLHVNGRMHAMCVLAHTCRKVGRLDGVRVSKPSNGADESANLPSAKVGGAVHVSCAGAARAWAWFMSMGIASVHARACVCVCVWSLLNGPSSTGTCMCMLIGYVHACCRVLAPGPRLQRQTGHQRPSPMPGGC